jgi:alcohol dehydrogenase class IV
MAHAFSNSMVKILLPPAASTTPKARPTTFVMPRLVMGADVFPEKGQGPAVSQLAALCEAKRAVVVSDDFGRHTAGRVAEALARAHFETLVWSDAQPEAPLQNVEEGAAAMARFGPDLIVAVGGGSVIDGAKAAWIRYARPDIGDLRSIRFFTPLGLRKKAHFAAVPTTSGTGSECTAFTVLHDTEAHRKVPVANTEIMPDLAVLCPEFTLSMPPGLTAGTGLDALSHAMDAVATPAANAITDALALQAIRLVFDYLPRAFRDGRDLEARQRMLTAASLAGIAFGQSGAALTHSFGHSVGSIFNIHHGRAVGVFIPYVFQFYQKVSDKFLVICDALELAPGSPAERMAALTALVRELFRELALPLTLAEMGIPAADLEARMDTLVRYTREDVDTLFSPRPISPEECARIFRCAHAGEAVDF